MPLPLRTDYDASLVRGAARKSKDGAQARRLLSLAAIYEGATRSEAARLGGVDICGGGELLRMGVTPAGRRTPALARMELVLSLSAGVPYGASDR